MKRLILLLSVLVLIFSSSSFLLSNQLAIGIKDGSMKCSLSITSEDWYKTSYDGSDWEDCVYFGECPLKCTRDHVIKEDVLETDTVYYRHIFDIEHLDFVDTITCFIHVVDEGQFYINEVSYGTITATQYFWNSMDINDLQEGENIIAVRLYDTNLGDETIVPRLNFCIDIYYDFNVGSNSPLCVDDTLKLFANYNSNWSYSWTGPNGFTSNIHNPQLPNMTESMVGEYTLTMTKGDVTKTFVVDVQLMESPLRLDDEFFLCKNNGSKIIGEDINHPSFEFDFEWFPKTGLTTPFSSTTEADPKTRTTYTLVAKAINSNCVFSDEITVDYYPTLVVDAGEDALICPGESVLLGGNHSVYDPTSSFDYSWSPSAGLDNPNIPNPTATPSQTQIYSLTVTDNNGCEWSDSVEIIIRPRPELDFVQVNRICLGDSIQIGNSDLVLNGIPPYSYKWEPNYEIINRFAPNPTVFPSEKRNYIVEITDGNGCVHYDSVTVDIPETTEIEAGGDRAVCQGDSVQIGLSDVVLSLEGGPFEIEWYPNENIVIEDHNKPIVFPQQTTVYSLHVTNRWGCSAMDTVEVVVFKSPEVDAGEDITICRGGEAKIGKKQENPNNEYKWIDNELIQDINKMEQTVTPETTTEFVLQGKNYYGCIKYDTIKVIVSPPINVELGKDVVICVNEKYVRQYKVSGGSERIKEVEWLNTENVDTRKQLSAIFDISEPGEYEYIVRAEDMAGCYGYDTLIVSVRDEPDISVSPANIDFGLLGACQSSLKKEFTLTNNENETITITSSETIFSFNSGLPVAIQPGESVTLSVRFAPKQVGKAEGTLTLFGDPCGFAKQFDLTGEKDELLINTDISSIDFGLANVCEDVRRDTTVVITNRSGADITITLDEANLAVPFELLNTESEITLAPEQSASLNFQYNPSNEGDFDAAFKIPYNASDCNDTIEIRFFGKYVSPNLDLSYNDLDVGELVGCDNSLDTTITLKNTGGTTIEITGFSTAGVLTSEDLPLTLQVGEEIAIDITFTPTAQGLINESINVNYMPCDMNETINIAGNNDAIVINTPFELDLGNLLRCSSSVLTRSFSIENNNNGIDLEVKAVSVSGDFTSNIKIGDIIKEGSVVDYIVEFTDNDLFENGELTGEIKLQFDPCDISKKIVLKAMLSDAELTPIAGSTDFGNVILGQSEVRTIQMLNTGTESIEINENIVNLDAPYKLIGSSPQFGNMLEVNDTLFLDVEFTPEENREYTQITNINITEPCNKSYEHQIMGTGINDILPELTLRLPVIRAATGEEISIPIEIINPFGIEKITGKKIHVRIGFDNSMIAFGENTDYGIVEGRNRFITLSAEYVKNKNILIEIDMFATLGVDSCTDIFIDSAYVLEDDVIFNLIDGEMCLTDVCIEGGIARFINPGNDSELLINPNPAYDNVSINYNLPESGAATLRVINELGEEMIRIIEQVKSGANGELTIDLSDLRSGTYSVIMNTMNYSLSKRIILIK